MAKQKTDLEGAFWLQVRGKKWDKKCTTQVKAIAGRKFAFDFCFSDYRLLIEIQGSIWVKGGHNTGSGLTRDYTKNNLATICGWDILYFTDRDIFNGSAIQQLEEYFERNKARRNQIS